MSGISVVPCTCPLKFDVGSAVWLQATVFAALVMALPLLSAPNAHARRRRQPEAQVPSHFSFSHTCIQLIAAMAFCNLLIEGHRRQALSFMCTLGACLGTAGTFRTASRTLENRGCCLCRAGGLQVAQVAHAPEQAGWHSGIGAQAQRRFLVPAAASLRGAGHAVKEAAAKAASATEHQAQETGHWIKSLVGVAAAAAAA